MNHGACRLTRHLSKAPVLLVNRCADGVLINVLTSSGIHAMVLEFSYVLIIHTMHAKSNSRWVPQWELETLSMAAFEVAAAAGAPLLL